MIFIAFITVTLALVSQGTALAQPPLTWTEKHQSTGGGYGIDCSTSGICIAALSRNGHAHTYLLRSTTSGNSWDTTYSSPYDKAQNIKSPGAGPVAFLSESTVLVGLDSSLILRSTDAGLSWQRLPVSSAPIRSYPTHLMRLSETEAVIVYKYGQANPGFEPDSMFITKDAGLTWTTPEKQPDISQRSQTFSIQGLYTNGDSRFGTIIYYSSDSGSTILLTETSDYGATWSERTIETDTRWGAYGATITYFDINRAVLTAWPSVDTGLVMKSWDGGKSWSRIFFGQITDDLGEPVFTGMLTSHFIDSLNGIAATRSGTLETTDGGYTWRESTSSKVWIPLELRLVDSNHAVGITIYGALVSGTRGFSTVVEGARVESETPALVVEAGALIQLVADQTTSPTPFSVVDLQGRAIESGIGMILSAPRVPGLYFITFGNEDHGRQTIRLLVTSQ